MVTYISYRLDKRMVLIHNILMLTPEWFMRISKNKTKKFTITVHPELYEVFESLLKEDGEYSNRNEFFERCMIRYIRERLEKKGQSEEQKQ